jgi:predicted DCC family thiol-disulfide oxidoreductase YuxK
VETAILYDRDCGFCNWALRRVLSWDRRRRLRPVPIQSEEGRRLLARVPEEQRLRSWHLVRPDGEVRSAGAAFPDLFAQLPGGGPLARMTARFPGATERGYQLIADNRSFFGSKLRLRSPPPSR